MQKVVAIVPVMTPLDSLNLEYQQKPPLFFSGGGLSSDINPEGLPKGIFVSVKGHPVFKVTKIMYPVELPAPPDASREIPRPTGASIEITFSHEPSNGECYLYVAVWAAAK